MEVSIMKKVFTIIFAVAACFAVSAQATDWSGIPIKYQPVKFNNKSVFSDTIGFDSSATIGGYHQVLEIDTTADNRWFLNSRNPYWDREVGAGTGVVLFDNTNSVILGASAATTSANLEVHGSISTIPEEITTEAATTLVAPESAIQIVINTTTTEDSIVDIEAASIGVEYIIVNADANENIYVSPWSFGQNGKTLYTSGGTPITLTPRDVVKILCTSDNTFFQSTPVVDNN